MQPPLATLPALVARRLAARLLPLGTPTQLRNGPGSGRLCDVCSHRILPADEEWRCIVRDAPALRLHLDCLTEWRRQATVPSGIDHASS